MNFLKKIFPVNYYAALFNLITLSLMVVLIIIHKNLPPVLPLWFSLSWGLDRLASPIFLWLLPASVLVFFVVSHVSSKLLTPTHAVLAQILVWTTAFLSLVFLLSTYKIILLTS